MRPKKSPPQQGGVPEGRGGYPLINQQNPIKTNNEKFHLSNRP